MSFFDEEYLKKRKERKKTIQERMSKIEESRTDVPKEDISALIKKVKKFYTEEMKKPVEQRHLYREEGEFGLHIIYFETDDEILTKQDGTPFNVPKMTKNDQLTCTMVFPLMTGDEDVFDKRVTIFTPPEQYGWNPIDYSNKPFPANRGFVARGKLTMKYLPQDPLYKGYALPITQFLAYMKKQEDYKDIKDLKFEDIDKDDYTVQYVFNQTQLLLMVKL